jgi:hypothetical protein
MLRQYRITVTTAALVVFSWAGISAAGVASATGAADRSVSSLAYDSVTDAAWLLEGLDYAVFVGTSSRDLPHSAPLTVAAQNPASLY